MRITNVIIASCILAMISAADQHEEMRCKARPGCQLAKCDSGLLSPSMKAIEYPVTCVRTSVQDGKEYNELKREIRIIRAAYELLDNKKMRMDKNVAALSEEMEALKTKLLKSDQSNKELLKEMGDLKIQLSKSDESNKALSNDIRYHASRITALENENQKTALQMIARRSCDGAKLESALARNDTGGVFHLYIPTIGFKNAFCDVTDDGGNWVVFQRRMNGDVDFYRNWDEYVKGFGDLQGDHWLGLEALHKMTKGGNMELKIKMITRKGIYWVVKYSNFSIGPGSDKYRLHVSGYSGNETYEDGTADDCLVYSNDEQFSTKDADHDGASKWHCASDNESGWWHDRVCAANNPNGNFNKTGEKGIWWCECRRYNLLRFSEMKFREK